MRAVVWAVAFFGVVAGTAWANSPQIQSGSFKCEYRPQVDPNWERRGAVQVEMQGTDLVLTFVDSDGKSSLNSVSTTNSNKEKRVEARCLGFVNLVNDKPFKIRDFKINLNPNEKPAIEFEKGSIEFKAKGLTTVIGTNQTDSFDKDWKMTKSDADKGSQFISQKESQTVCGNQLSLRFDELRATLVGETDLFTFISVQSFLVSLDPC